MEMLEHVNIIRSLLNDTKYNFVAIGYHLRRIDNDKLYRKTGHDDIWKFAMAQFGLSKSTASRLMNINKRFSAGGYSDQLAEDYQKFNVSQMSEMLTLTDEQISKIDGNTTIRGIRAMKPKKEPKKKQEAEEPLEGQMSMSDYPDVMPEPEIVATSQQEAQTESVSPFGCTKSEYPMDSLIQSKGCGNKHNCFCCAQDCKIRQEDRYCVEAPLGNPFSCTTMNVLENLKDDFGDVCQFINQELAKKRCGDGEPDPCCKTCNVYDCGYRCKRAINLGFKKKKKEEAAPVEPESEEDACKVEVIPEGKNAIHEDDPEYFNLKNVQFFLDKAKLRLQECRQRTGMNVEAHRHQAIDTAAYSLLADSLQDTTDKIKQMIQNAVRYYNLSVYSSAEFYLYQARKILYETKEYDKGPIKPEVNEFPVKRQELPVMKNNKSREEFIDGFMKWPI